MNKNNAIEVSNVSKSFRIYTDRSYTLMESLLFWKRKRYEKREVIKDISFEIKKGEAVGLIGHNGCGKSTMLKLLSKILYPDSGNIKIDGRVSSLIELGAGFHPDMSGRENIYINASIFGLTKKEIDKRLDDIIEFSELGEYIDNPVRTYSSGMYMRLAFSVAINVDADILLIDEILAVGDAGFQTKCFNRLKEIKANGTTIIIVSHSLSQIEQICDRSIWIHKGVIKEEGAPRDVHPEYMDYMAEERQQISKVEQERKKFVSDAKKEQRVEKGEEEDEKKQKNRWGSGKAKITDIYALDADGNRQSTFFTGQRFQIVFDYEMKEKIEDAVFGVGFFRTDGTYCYGTNTRIDRIKEFDITSGGTVKFDILNMNLLPGKYSLDVAIEEGMGIPVDYYKSAFSFEVFSKLDDVGLTRIEHKWDIN